MFAEYSAKSGGGGRTLPRVVLVGVEPATARRPVGDGALDLLVTIHEEGTPLTWRRHISLSSATEQRLLAHAEQLHLWSNRMGMTRSSAARTAQRLGRDLYRSFLGRSGAQTLEALQPTALLLQVDETLVNLPWELMWSAAGPVVMETPFGRVVTTATVPQSRRDPVAEDPVLRILAVANPTQDLKASEAEIAAIRGLPEQLDGAGTATDVKVEVTVLERDEATVQAFRDTVQGQDFDLVHFAGHATFDPGDPQASALHLSDGRVSAGQVSELGWRVPPYVVFNSACESARAGAGRRLVSPRGRTNGLAAAFLAAGVEAYLGHYWPVGDASAGRFADCFYRSLFTQRNIGAAVLEARTQAGPDFGTASDLTGFGAVYFGDPGTAERRDTGAMAS